MKKFFKENWLWMLLAIIIAAAIVSLILNIFWLKKLILAPFAVLGGYSALKGFFSLVEKIVDDRKANTIKAGLVLLTYIISVIALAVWITEW